MGKEIKVTLLDKNTIRIEENANPGDLIYLSNIANIDMTKIELLINEGKDKEYEKRLNDALESKDKQFKAEKELAIKEAKEQCEVEIAKYKGQIDKFESEKQLAVKDAKEEKQTEIEALKQKIALKDAEKENDLLKQKNSLEEQFRVNIQEQIEKDDTKYNELKEEFDALNDEYKALKEVKIRLNNKEIGEDLESFCDDVVNELMQIGFDNCTWDKDNESVKAEGEAKGTKADYIFKVYLDEKHEGEPLASVCLEMKNESIVSQNKKKNSDHYDKLDKDRAKKGCKYALLVSNLETENDNISPIMKVNKYPDMYMVRPAYLTTFLTIITSLTMKFKDIIIADKNAQLDLASKMDFITEFEKVKKTYLDDPLKTLDSELQSIRKANSSIQDAASKINTACDNIITKYINKINDKLDKYNKEIIKSYKKLEK